MRTSFRVALTALLVLASPQAWAQAKGTIRLGVEIPASIVNVPMFMAVDRLKDMGYEVRRVEFQSPETMTLALQNREVDIIGTSVGTAYSAIDAGFQGKAFLGMASSDFLMVARKELTSCESLDGKRIAVQSREGTTGVLAARWFEKECPRARPNIMIVPGSENRVAGLIAGQLDASPIDSQNTAQLMALRPGQFDTIKSFGQGDKLLASVYISPTAWLDQNKEMLKVLAKTYVHVLHEAQRDRAPFVARTKELLATTDPKIVEAVVDSWLTRDVFVPVWGVDPHAVEGAIKFYSSARPYRRIKTASDVSTNEFVEGLKDR
jgi:ABC-type nitrate/sulfonate/bicarbonate transport system substrate-binding protein